MGGREVFVNRSWVIIEYLPNIIITVVTLNVNLFHHFLISCHLMSTEILDAKIRATKMTAGRTQVGEG